MSGNDCLFEVVYGWRRGKDVPPPPDELLYRCFRHGASTVDAITALGAAAWGVPVESLLVSSAQRKRRDGGNCFEAKVSWEAVTADEGQWPSVWLAVSFEGLWGSMGPLRFDVYVAPVVSTDPWTPEKYDYGDDGQRRVAERIEAMKPALRDLVAFAYGVQVDSIALTPPKWRPESMPESGGDAFEAAGVVRLIEGHETVGDR